LATSGEAFASTFKIFLKRALDDARVPRHSVLKNGSIWGDRTETGSCLHSLKSPSPESRSSEKRWGALGVAPVAAEVSVGFGGSCSCLGFRAHGSDASGHQHGSAKTEWEIKGVGLLDRKTVWGL